ncbi:prion-inhibition and propagation-domain-containing protein [Hypomontagnella monticulosa]|nr:prion-inhibition and propagation-domain-containing protein [Hypomontagnella monticulosa]
MAEIFGVVVSTLSVATLFDNCVDCFRYIQLGRNFGRDFERCQLKLDIAMTRLSRWGQAVGINENPLFKENSSNQISQQVQAILEEIEQLFHSICKSSKRYEITAKPGNLTYLEPENMQPAALRLHKRLHLIASWRQRQTSLPKKITWALYDASEFDKYIGHLTGFVDDLEKLFPIKDNYYKLVEIEIEDVNDEPSLTLLQHTAAETDQVLADAAIKKLEGCRVRNSAKSTHLEEQARMRVGNEWSEAAPAQCLSSVDWAVNEVEVVVAKGTSVFHVGNSYGGRSVFD